MNHSIIQIDMDNPQTHFCHFTILNPFYSNTAQLKPAHNKINNNFGTTGHRIKIQMGKLVRILFPIELFYLFLDKTIFCIELFLPH